MLENNSHQFVTMSEQNEFSEQMREHAEQYLGETAHVRQEAIEEIRQYLIDNPAIGANNDHFSILTFLRCCKFNVEKTKLKMRNYYEMRAKMPEWFSNRDPKTPEISELLKLGVFIPIIQLKPGPLVVIIRTGAHDPSKHKQSDVFKTGKMILDLAVREYESATIFGVYAIFDMSNVTYHHAKQLTPSMIKKAVFAWQNYHCRPQKLEFVNAPVYINVVLNIFRTFMSEKMKSRVHIHWVGKGFDELHKLIPVDELPEEFGGTNGQLDDFVIYWERKVLENIEWYKEDEKYKANLSEL